MTDHPSSMAVAREYFARMQAGDPSVVELFTEDAELIGLGTRVVGLAAVGEFYEGTMRDAGPVPEVLAFAADGDVVFAEIMIAVAGTEPIHVVDRFEVDAGRIRSLTYFLADYPR